MIAHLLQTLHHLPATDIYLFVFFWLAAESCGVPLPNELVLLLTGSLVGDHLGARSLSPLSLVLVATAGSLAGASIAYAIGSRGGRAAVTALGRRIHLDESRLASVERWFSSTGTVAVLISRVTPFVRTVASFPAGMLRFPVRRFLAATALGSLLWCTVLVTVGDVLGANYTVALGFIQRYTIPAIIVLVALVAGYFWLHNRLAHVSEGKAAPDQSESV